MSPRRLKKGKILPAAKGQKSYAWHASEADEVLNLIGSSETGLSEREVTERRKQFGPNQLTEIPAPGIFARIFEQLKSPLVLVLIGACILTIGLEEYIDATVIAIAFLAAISIGVLQEGRASRAFEKLSKSQTHAAIVIRNAKRHEVLASELVPGDVVELQSGMYVPADLRILSSKKLAINEASLTGEWQAVDKHSPAVAIGTPLPDQTSMAWLGTFVADGHGTAVVVETGDRTEMGSLVRELQFIDDAKTPLQVEVRKVSTLMLYIIAFLTAAVIVIGVLSEEPVTEMVLIAVAIAVAAVPEGLPAAVTIILAVGMESLLRRGGLVRNLLAAETLGSTTYVLTDKTGTLTEARLALHGIITADTENLDPGAWGKREDSQFALDTSVYATDAYEDKTNGQSVLRGDPVEKAILGAAIKSEIVASGENAYADRLDYLAFNSDNRFAAGLRPEKGKNRLCINGAPELLLEKASHYYSDGKAHKMNEAVREEFITSLDEYTKEGKRLIAVAYKEVDYEEIGEGEKTIKNLINKCVFVGLLVFTDPIRPGVIKAIEGVKSAGAKVILVTGDNPATALSIGRQTGIAGASEGALTGTDLEELSDEELLEVLNTVHVFARVLPKQKLRLAELLQKRGEIVAMTGDGTNDALALKRANIGVAIGSGTEVAKESSDLVLIKDSFEIIYAAIEEGRRIIANLRKIIGYLLSTSLSEVVLITTALLVGAPVPILPTQILWANLVEEGFMSVAFAFEPGEKDAMKQTPQDIHEEGLLSARVLWFIAFVVTILSILMLTLYFYFLYLEIPLLELRSAMFLAVSLDSLFIAFAFRSLSTPIWRQPLHTNLFFLGSFTVSALALLAALSVPFLQTLVSYEPLPMNDILLVLAFSVLSLITVEVGKYLFFEKKAKN